MTVTGTRTLWAVGADSALTAGTILYRWSGSLWKPASFPLRQDHLAAMAASPAGTAWAVGSNSGFNASVSMLWNGKTWS
jgi:hypothetical protein